jgi:hypothetical protein
MSVATQPSTFPSTELLCTLKNLRKEQEEEGLGLRMRGAQAMRAKAPSAYLKRAEMDLRLWMLLMH